MRLELIQIFKTVKMSTGRSEPKATENGPNPLSQEAHLDSPFHNMILTAMVSLNCQGQSHNTDGGIGKCSPFSKQAKW